MENTFNVFIKSLKSPPANAKVLQIAVLADFATQHLVKAIKAAGNLQHLVLEVWEADYDSVDQTINNTSSSLYTKKFDYIFIFPSVLKLYKQFHKANKLEFAEEQIARLGHFVKILSAHSSAKIIISNLPELDDRIFGNFSNKIKNSFIYQLRKLNIGVMELAVSEKNLFVLDIQYLQSLYGRAAVLDDKLYIHADIIYQLDFLVHIAQGCIQVINANQGIFKKCVIVDLDNTIWGGIIGDDGIENIEIGGDLGLGKAYYFFQLWLKSLKERGIILAVCSKNTDTIAKEPFLKHPDMVLKIEDISVFVANWETKVDNILFIQSVLNIGFDSIVFLDDNPFERDIVKQNIPDIIVPDLPVDPAEYLSFLQGLNLFETASFTEADLERTNQYQQEAMRTIYKRTFSTENEYLESLNMAAEIKAIDKFTLPRVAQLTQRSNQFNLRTVRYAESDIQRLIDDKNYFTLTISLSDTFGDHGLISVLILKRIESDTMFIDSWIMSCRVLKRGVENLVLNQIVELARQNNIRYITGEYIPTAKNQIVKDHYLQLGFQNKGSIWTIDIETYLPKVNFIQKVNSYAIKN